MLYPIRANVLFSHPILGRKAPRPIRGEKRWQTVRFPALGTSSCLILLSVQIRSFCYCVCCISISKVKSLCFLSFSASVEVFLRFLQKEYQWSTNSVKTISSQLAKDDITSVRLLAMCWRGMQERFPIGMRKMIDKELRKRDMISWTRHGQQSHRSCKDFEAQVNQVDIV